MPVGFKWPTVCRWNRAVGTTNWFKDDMKTQRQEPMPTRTQPAGPIVQDLGRHHAACGVNDDHSDGAGRVQSWTFDDELGGEFALEAKAACAA